MNQIVTLTGIKAHTLRKWETRYSFLEPERTTTNIRFYSDSQLRKLLNISVLTRNGYRISKIDKMSENEIHDTIANQLTEGDNENEISAMILCMIALDESKFDELLKSLIIRKGLLATTTEIIYPFLSQVGVLWGINRVLPAQEHFISSLIKKKMFATIDLLPDPQKDAPSIIMFLTEEEYHEMGLLLAYYIARELGFRVYYLGANVPTENIKEVIDAVNPNAMLTMFVAPSENSVESKVQAIIDQGDTTFFVSGNPNNMGSLLNDKRIIYLSHPNNLIEELKKIKESN
jgi:DNA-binding transcriptional MerR regulator